MNVCSLEENFDTNPPTNPPKNNSNSYLYMYPGTVYIHTSHLHFNYLHPVKISHLYLELYKDKNKTMAFNFIRWLNSFRSSKCKQECISHTLRNKLNDEKYNPFINTLNYTNKLYLFHFKFILKLKLQYFSTPDLFL